MNHKLARLSGTARKQRPKDSNIKSPLQRRKSHLHERRAPIPLRPLGRMLIQAGTTTSGGLRTVVPGKSDGIHGDDAAEAAREHTGPLLLGDLLAMVGAGGGSGVEFLLEESRGLGPGSAELVQVIQVLFVP